MTHCMEFEEFMDVLENSQRISSKPTYEVIPQTIEINGEKEKVSSQDLAADLFSGMTDSELVSHFMPIRGVDYDQNYISDDSVKMKKVEDTQMAITDELLQYRMIPQLNNNLYQLNSAFKPIIPNNRRKETNEPPIADILKCKTELPEIMSSVDNCENSTKEKQITSNYSPSDAKCNIPYKEKNEVFPKDSPRALHMKEGKPNSIDKTSEPSNNIVAYNGRITTTAADINTNKEDRKNYAVKKTECRPIMKRKPRTYKYNPKPLQHKVNRAFVPENLKDIEYWERRKRNNEAAKKSRKERRKKELEIVNNYEEMRHQFQTIKIENIRLKARNAILEKQLKELKMKK